MKYLVFLDIFSTMNFSFFNRTKHNQLVPFYSLQILERHLVVGREIPQAELENMKSIETSRGKMDIRNVNGKIHLLWEGREAVIVRPDVQATNGVIHVISKVMMLRRDMTSSAVMPTTSWLLVVAMLVLRTARFI